MAWVWEDHSRVFILGWTIPLIRPLFQPLLHESNQNWHLLKREQASCWEVNKLHWDPESVTQSSWPSSLYMLCWALWESGIWVWSTTRFMLPSWWICFKPEQFLFLSLSPPSVCYYPEAKWPCGPISRLIGPSQCVVIILMCSADCQSKKILIYCIYSICSITSDKLYIYPLSSLFQQI